MIAGGRLYLHILLFIYLFSSCQFAMSQQWAHSSTAGLPNFWINKPFIDTNYYYHVYYSTDFPSISPVLEEVNTQYLCGFFCNYKATECLFGIHLGSQLVWFANRNYPVKANATLQLGQDGNLVLADSDGTVVWSTNTAGESVFGLNLTETGNLVLLDLTGRTIWQSFDHPTDCLLPGQTLVSGQTLMTSISSSNRSKGLFSLAILNGSLIAYTDSDPPQPYYYDSRSLHSPYYSFSGHIFSALQRPLTSGFQFIKLDPDGHLRAYHYDGEATDILTPYVGNCGYPNVCGRYSICTRDGNCICPFPGNFFRQLNVRSPVLGCAEVTPISCYSLHYHSLIELKNTTYFANLPNIDNPTSSNPWSGAKELEDCKRACLSNCLCKGVVWAGTPTKKCLLLDEVFSIMDNAGEERDGTMVFLKVQNQSQSKHSRLFNVTIGSTLATFVGIILTIIVLFLLFKKRIQSSKVTDISDLAPPILPGILPRFPYSDLKIITKDFSRKLGEGGFGTVYEGTLSDGTKLAVKCLDGLGQVKDSFITEVEIFGRIHHVNLVKLIGFCAEKDHQLLIYEYMVNGSLDRWIFLKNQENGLTWHTRQRIVSDIAKGLAYLHDECSQKVIHLDIKPQNILLDQNFNAKICDFGLSKHIEKDKSKVMTRMRGTPGYLAPEWLRSGITEKVDVYAFGIVLLEILCGRKNLDRSQADEEDYHLLSVFRRKAEQQKLVDIVDRNSEDMQLHQEAVVEMMSLAAWCLQADFTKRPSMTLVVKALEGLASVETNLNYNFTNLPEVGAGSQQREATISSILPSVLSGPR